MLKCTTRLFSRLVSTMKQNHFSSIFLPQHMVFLFNHRCQVYVHVPADIMTSRAQVSLKKQAQALQGLIQRHTRETGRIYDLVSVEPNRVVFDGVSERIIDTKSFFVPLEHFAPLFLEKSWMVPTSHLTLQLPTFFQNLGLDKLLFLKRDRTYEIECRVTAHTMLYVYRPRHKKVGMNDGFYIPEGERVRYDIPTALFRILYDFFKEDIVQTVQIWEERGRLKMVGQNDVSKPTLYLSFERSDLFT